jgi:hypothetical protein
MASSSVSSIVSAPESYRAGEDEAEAEAKAEVAFAGERAADRAEATRRE